MNIDFIIEKLDSVGLIKISKKEKFYLLNSIRAVSKAGQSEKKAIENKIIEYQKRKKYNLLFLMKKVKAEIDKGKKLAEALKVAQIISNREYHILVNSKGGIAKGIEKIIETNKKSSKSMAGFLLFLVPPTIMIVALLASHSYVKKVLVDMTEPIRSSGGVPPPLPNYLDDPHTYIVLNVLYFVALIIFFGSIAFIKKYYPKKFLGLIPIIEEEYVLDILTSFKTVSAGGGINMSNSAKALRIGETNRIKALILDGIIDSTQRGKSKISEVFEDFGTNYNTISALKFGEDSYNINIGLDIAIEDLQARYDRNLKIFLKAGMYGGQLAMLGIAGKPMVDIMLYMSVSQLNFQI